MSDIKPLPKSVQESLRSGQHINSYSSCITQLVYNSLDANATSIAIRINLISHKIQIIDNGDGISINNFKLIGEQYMTSKYNTIKSERKAKYTYGYRGETIFSIRQLSSTLNITSRTRDSKNTYSKSFEYGKTLKIEKGHRSCVGTTVTIENFLYNNPVRQNYLDNETILNEVKNKLECIVLIHPNTSFTLRNDVSGEIIFQIPKTKYVIKTCEFLYGSNLSQNLRKIYLKNENLTIGGLIGLKTNIHSKIQFIYINKRNINKTNKIHEVVNSILLKSLEAPFNELDVPIREKHGVYIITINCPTLEINTIDFSEPVIEFKLWKNVLFCIKQAIEILLRKQNLLNDNNTKLVDSEPIVDKQLKITDLSNVFQGKKIVRNHEKKSKMNLVKLNVKKQRIINDNKFNINKKFDNLKNDKNKFKNTSEKIGSNVDNCHVTRESNLGKHFLLGSFSKSNDIPEEEIYSEHQENTSNNNAKNIQKCDNFKTNSAKENLTLQKYDYFSIQKNITNEPKVYNKNHIDDKYKEKNYNVNKNNIQNVCSTIQRGDLVTKHNNLPSCDSSYGKKCIMDIFLKSTIVYKKDYELNSLCLTESDRYTKGYSVVSKTKNIISLYKNTLVSKQSNTVSIKKCFDVYPKMQNKSKYICKNIISQNIYKNMNPNKLQQYTQFLRRRHSLERKRQLLINTLHRNFNAATEKHNSYTYNSYKQNYIKRNNYNSKRIEKLANNCQLIDNIKNFHFSPKNIFPKHKSYNYEYESTNTLRKNKIERSIKKKYFNYGDDRHFQIRKKYIYPVTPYESTYSHRPIVLCRSNHRSTTKINNDIRNYLNAKNSIKQYNIFKKQNECYNFVKPNNIPLKRKSKNNFVNDQNTLISNKKYDKRVLVPNNIFIQPNAINLPAQNKYNKNACLPYMFTYNPETSNVQEIPNTWQSHYDRNKFLNQNACSIYKTQNIKRNINIHVDMKNDLTINRKNKENLIKKAKNKLKSKNYTISKDSFIFKPNLHSTPKEKDNIESTEKSFFQQNFNSKDFTLLDKNSPGLSFFINANMDTQIPKIIRPNNNLTHSDMLYQQNLPKIQRNNVKETIAPSVLKKKLSTQKTSPVFSSDTPLKKILERQKLFNKPLIYSNTEKNQNENIKTNSDKSFLIISLDNSLRKGNDVVYTKKNSAITSNASVNNNKEIVHNLEGEKNTDKNDLSFNINRGLNKFTKSKHIFEIKSNFCDVNKRNVQCNNFFGKEYKSTSTLDKQLETKNKSVTSPDILKTSNSFDVNNYLEIIYTNETGNNNKSQNPQNDTKKQENKILDTKEQDKFKKKLVLNHTKINAYPENKEITTKKDLKTNIFENNISNIDNARIIPQNNFTTQENKKTENNPYKVLEIKTNVQNEKNKEWIKKSKKEENDVFVNVRTGMSIFQMPNNDNTFSITTRNNIIPKGMSPIMFAVSKPSQELTPTSKDVLYETMAKNNSDDDVKTIKWLKYFKQKDVNSFFGSLYEEMKHYESDVPTIKQKLSKAVQEYTFKKDMFGNVNVINQWDKKFIIVTYKDNLKRKILVLFDQHATDERIRLENLLKRYKDSYLNVYKKINCKKSFQLRLTNTELYMMKNLHVQKQFENWGIIYKMEQQNSIFVTHIPLFLQLKDDTYKSNIEDSYIKQLILFVIKEQDSIMNTTGRISAILPMSLLNIIKTEACRAAFKFGDKISKKKCEELIKNLSKCDLPFECAHGRPTLSVVGNLNEMILSEKVQRVDLKKIKLNK